jgi:hypothetical protein
VATYIQEWATKHYDVLKDFAGPTLTLVGFIITICIAIGGFRSFGRWKREKIEERRIDVALDALAIAYESKIRFDSIRFEDFEEWEYEEAAKQTGPMSYPTPPLRKGQEVSYIILKRIERNGEYFDRVDKIEPKFMAVFGAETTEIFSNLYDAKLQIRTAAQALYDENAFEHDPADMDARERSRKLREELFGGGDFLPNREVDQKIARFRAAIEVLCRPIVDQQFGRLRRR